MGRGQLPPQPLELPYAKVNVPSGDLTAGKCNLALVCGHVIGATRENETTFLKVATGISFHRNEHC